MIVVQNHASSSSATVTPICFGWESTRRPITEPGACSLRPAHDWGDNHAIMTAAGMITLRAYAAMVGIPVDTKHTFNSPTDRYEKQNMLTALSTVMCRCLRRNGEIACEPLVVIPLTVAHFCHSLLVQSDKDRNVQDRQNLPRPAGTRDRAMRKDGSYPRGRSGAQ